MATPHHAPADVDLYEVNEAFAEVPLHFAEQMDVDAERLNVNGRAIAMGHLLGTTGGVLVGTALDELERRDATVAVVGIGDGAGLAVSAMLERV